MTRKIKKARIQEGYPKLATQNYADTTYYNHFCIESAGYRHVAYKAKAGELIVLLAGYKVSDERWFHYYIPFQLLAEQKIPINAVLTWAANYNRYPRHQNNAITIL